MTPPGKAADEPGYCGRNKNKISMFPKRRAVLRFWGSKIGRAARGPFSLNGFELRCSKVFMECRW